MSDPEPLALFDCDHHYYEAPDAFTRHVPKVMQPRCVQWAEIDGRRRHVVGGKLDLSVGNPGFDPVARPGVLYDYYKGNPRGLPAAEMMRGQLEPQPAAYRKPEARLAVMDAPALISASATSAERATCRGVMPRSSSASTAAPKRLKWWTTARFAASHSRPGTKLR